MKAKAKHLNRLLPSLGAPKNLLMLFCLPSFASSSTSSIFLFADFELPSVFAILICGLNIIDFSGFLHENTRGVKHVQNGGIGHHIVVHEQNSEIGIMSRLIVRNLPKNIKDERIRSIFAAKGELTDVKLCHTKDGKFRRFGFIGYKTEDQAKAALQHFNSSFIDTSKITVDFAKSLGDESLPRPWSRYSEGSSANDRLKKKKESKAEKLKDRVSKPTDREAKEPSDTHSINKKKSGVVNEKNNKEWTKALDELEHDTEFQEFLSVHKHCGTKQIWSNDNVEHGQPKSKESQIRQRKEKAITANKV